MKLYGMLDSPYVRRVAISLAIYGYSFELIPLSVFADFKQFATINPAVKAPTLALDDGTRLMESTLILDYFEALAHTQHKLMPQEAASLAQDLHLLGFILVACEKTVQIVYEQRLRPEEKQYQPWQNRITTQLHAACQVWNEALATRNHRSSISQVTLSSAVVWQFMQFVLPETTQRLNCPTIQALSDEMAATPAFQQYPLA
jgi:glutathione S-transferase